MAFISKIKLPSGSEYDILGFKRDLLWKNASPKSEFMGSSSYPISCLNLPNYDTFLLQFMDSSSGIRVINKLATRNPDDDNRAIGSVFFFIGNYIYNRVFKIEGNKTYFYIYNCNRLETNTGNNTSNYSLTEPYLIPLSVYGLIPAES